MTSKELIKTLMTEHDITNAEMAKTLGITQAALWDRLNPKKSDNTTVAKLGDMLSVMGYKIVVAQWCGLLGVLQLRRFIPHL